MEKIKKEEFAQNGGKEILFKLLQSEVDRRIEEEQQEILRSAQKRKILLSAAINIGRIFVK